MTNYLKKNRSSEFRKFLTSRKLNILKRTPTSCLYLANIGNLIKIFKCLFIFMHMWAIRFGGYTADIYNVRQLHVYYTWHCRISALYKTVYNKIGIYLYYMYHLRPFNIKRISQKFLSLVKFFIRSEIDHVLSEENAKKLSLTNLYVSYGNILLNQQPLIPGLVWVYKQASYFNQYFYLTFFFDLHADTF